MSGGASVLEEVIVGSQRGLKGADAVVALDLFSWTGIRVEVEEHFSSEIESGGTVTVELGFNENGRENNDEVLQD